MINNKSLFILFLAIFVGASFSGIYGMGYGINAGSLMFSVFAIILGLEAKNVKDTPSYKFIKNDREKAHYRILCISQCFAAIICAIHYSH